MYPRFTIHKTTESEKEYNKPNVQELSTHMENTFSSIVHFPRLEGASSASPTIWWTFYQMIYHLIFSIFCFSYSLHFHPYVVGKGGEFGKAHHAAQSVRELNNFCSCISLLIIHGIFALSFKINLKLVLRIREAKNTNINEFKYTQQPPTTAERAKHEM